MTGKITPEEAELKARIGSIPKGPLCLNCAEALAACGLTVHGLVESVASEEAFHDAIKTESVRMLLKRCPNLAVVAAYKMSGLIV